MRRAEWKEAAITVDRLRELLEYVPDTGELIWRERIGKAAFNAKLANRKAGCLVNGYVMITFGTENARVYGHRVALAISLGEWPTGEVDHIDGNRSNNRLSNLRVASSSENCRNKTRTLGAIPFKGVTWEAALGKYRARIKTAAGRMSLGMFASPDEAARAYDMAAIRFHGEFAVTNASLGLVSEVSHA